MALLSSKPVQLGWRAADFSLPGVDGQHHTLRSVRGAAGLLVMFICNHCPYVLAIRERIRDTARELQSFGFGVVAINANDPVQYPEDSFANMKKFVAANGFSFPYLFDENQQVARAYDAVCTPEFYGFDQDLTLRYRGRLDDGGKNGAAQTPELLWAMKAIAAGTPVGGEQMPSMGCSIKWKMESAA